MRWIKARWKAFKAWYVKADRRYKAWDKRTGDKWDNWKDL